MNREIQHRVFDEDRVKNNFANISPFYDFWAQRTESAVINRLLHLADIQLNERVLEVGVGTGLLFEHVLQKNKKGFTAGIDLSHTMLEKARTRIKYFRPNRNFSLQAASAYELPFDDQSFDCLISCYVLDLLPENDFEDVLHEFKRVLRPGGRMLLASMTFGWKWFHPIWDWMAKTFPDLMTDCRPIDLRSFVEGAGFSIEIEEKISQNTFPSQLIEATIS